MSTNLPDFDKARYVPENEAELSAGHELTGAAWDGVQAEGGLVKATLAGVVAAIVGSVAYAAFTIVTHIEIGFIALFLGAFIASAMMQVTGKVGGRQYQIAAAVLTYLSYCGAAVIELLWGLHKEGLDVSRIRPSFYPQLAWIGIASPFLALRSFVSGAIGLFILYLAIRSAWKVAAGVVTASNG